MVLQLAPCLAFHLWSKKIFYVQKTHKHLWLAPTPYIQTSVDLAVELPVLEEVPVLEELPVFVEGLELSVEQEVEDVELSLKKELKS